MCRPRPEFRKWQRKRCSKCPVPRLKSHSPASAAAGLAPRRCTARPPAKDGGLWRFSKLISIWLRPRPASRNWRVARELFVQDTAQARQWLRPLFRQLKTKSSGRQQVLGTLKELLRAKENMTPAQREQLAKEIGYFTTHAHRMNYAQAKRQQQPVGSGAIESTCRQYQVRFKRVGQFWSLAGDEALLALETLRRNERWPLLFPHADQKALVASKT